MHRPPGIPELVRGVQNGCASQTVVESAGHSTATQRNSLQEAAGGLLPASLQQGQQALCCVGPVRSKDQPTRVPASSGEPCPENALDGAKQQDGNTSNETAAHLRLRGNVGWASLSESSPWRTVPPSSQQWRLGEAGVTTLGKYFFCSPRSPGHPCTHGLSSRL